MNSVARSIDEVVEDITRLHRSLPPRPDVDEVEAAVGLLRAVDREEKSRIESITRQQQEQKSSVVVVPAELFGVQEKLQKNMVYFQSREQKREAMKLLDLESTHALFDELVQEAERCLAPSSYALLEKEVKMRRRSGGSEVEGIEQKGRMGDGKPAVFKRFPSREFPCYKDLLIRIKFSTLFRCGTHLRL